MGFFPRRLNPDLRPGIVHIEFLSGLMGNVKTQIPVFQMGLVERAELAVAQSLRMDLPVLLPEQPPGHPALFPLFQLLLHLFPVRMSVGNEKSPLEEGRMEEEQEKKGSQSDSFLSGMSPVKEELLIGNQGREREERD